MNRKVSGRIAVITVAVGLAGCASQVRQWREITVADRPFEDVWEGVMETARRNTMSYDPTSSDRGRGKLFTRWRGGAYGFGRSQRVRLRAEIDRERPEQSWLLRFCVEQQHVEDMARSLEPSEADWTDDGQNPALEDVMEMQLRLRFGLVPGVGAPRT